MAKGAEVEEEQKRPICEAWRIENADVLHRIQALAEEYKKTESVLGRVCSVEEDFRVCRHERVSFPPVVPHFALGSEEQGVQDEDGDGLWSESDTEEIENPLPTNIQGLKDNLGLSQKCKTKLLAYLRDEETNGKYREYASKMKHSMRSPFSFISTVLLVLGLVFGDTESIINGNGGVWMPPTNPHTEADYDGGSLLRPVLQESTEGREDLVNRSCTFRDLAQLPDYGFLALSLIHI